MAWRFKSSYPHSSSHSSVVELSVEARRVGGSNPSVNIADTPAHEGREDADARKSGSLVQIFLRRGVEQSGSSFGSCPKGREVRIPPPL